MFFYKSSKSKTSAHKLKSRTLQLESLDGRKLMAGDVYSSSPAPSPATPITLPAFDSTLSVVLRQCPYEVQGKMEVYVDGSDYRDVVRITGYQPGSLGTVSITLEQYSNNNVLLSSRSLRLHSPNFASSYQVSVDSRGGNDDVVNMTAASLRADGGSGNDFLSGGSSYDLMYGGAGSNILYGNDGSDVINGGEETDLIYGGAGSDSLWGNGGVDTIYGDNGSENQLFPGMDTIHGGAGNDKIWGNAGDDSIWGDDGDDTIDGGIGNDKLYGGNDNDTLLGQAGMDQLFGESGRDKLYGGAGDDNLDGGFWSSSNLNEGDELSGGAGADTFIKYRVHFGSDDIDTFVDYNTIEHDKILEKWSYF